MNRTRCRLALALASWACLSSAACAQFDIQINYTGTGVAEFRYAFEWAEAQLERRITGYQPGINLTGLTINASLIDIPDLDDGVGTVDRLGQANYTSTTFQGGYRLATAGYMEFDTDDLPLFENPPFPDDVTPYNVLPYIVLHEMAHVLGFGTLWSQNGLVAGSRYIGEHALSAYQREWIHPGGVDPQWIPIETEGGAGTANFHWDEAINGSAFTGLLLASDPTKDFAYELMTGWLNYRRYPPIISRTTIQQFADLGYTVVPEPATQTIGLVGGGLLAVYSRRRLARIGRHA